MEERTHAHSLLTMKQRIVLDTNCFLISIPSRSHYHKVFTDFINGRYTLCITNEIILEYEEILTQKVGKMIASNIINAILSNSNTLYVNPHYRFNLIEKDKDDNKFVDCALIANAHYIVTQDHHYDVLKDIDYPKVSVINIDEFIKILSITRY